MTAKSEDVEIWRVARALVCAIYGVTGRGGFFRDACLRDEVRQGSVSLLADLGQALETGRTATAASLVEDMLGRCSRVRSLLIVAADQDYLTDVELHGLSGQLLSLRDGVAAFFAVSRHQQGEAARQNVAVLYNGVP